MTPDSALGALAQRVARVEQRVDDLMERIVERFAGVAEDIRIFAPMVREHDEMRAEMRFVRESVTSLLAQQKLLETRIQEERQLRIEGQRERKEELEAAIAERTAEMARLEADRVKQHKEMRTRVLVATLALLGVFATSLGGIIVAYIAQRGGP